MLTNKEHGREMRKSGTERPKKRKKETINFNKEGRIVRSTALCAVSVEKWECLGKIWRLSALCLWSWNKLSTWVHSSPLLSPAAPPDVERHWSIERDLSGSTSSTLRVCVRVCVCCWSGFICLCVCECTCAWQQRARAVRAVCVCECVLHLVAVFLSVFMSHPFCQAVAFTRQTTRAYGKWCALKLLKLLLLHEKQCSAAFSRCNYKMSTRFWVRFSYSWNKTWMF